ncbi:MAG: hypothetical protein IJ028_07530, partial [Alistipes sp.]|nr:hypothetical protein [Alistipes sp.]
MRRLWMFMAAAALTSTACTKEVIENDYNPTDTEGRRVQFTISEVEGRTAFGESTDGTTYPTLWNDGDQIKVNYNLAYDTENTTSLLVSDADGKNPKVTTYNNGKNASFEVALTEAVTYPCTFYAVYPASSWTHWNDTASGIFFLKLPDTQIATADSCDPNAQLLIGASDEQEAESDQVSLRFKHFSAYGLFSLAGLPEGATLSSVKITAAKEIAGTLYYDVKNATYEGSQLKKSITVTTSSADKIWVALLPVDLSNTTLKVEATTRLGTYTKSITLGDNRKLQSGHIAKMTIDLSDATFVPREDVMVGDVWYEAGKPVGVVFWVSEDKETIKILHLQRTTEKIAWSDNTNKEGLSAGNDANPDGAANTAKLQTKYASSIASVPMLAYLNTLNADGNDWYWPSRNEFREICIAYEGMSGTAWGTFDDNVNTPDKLAAERRAAQIAFDKILIDNGGVALNTRADGDAGGDASDDNLTTAGDYYWVSNENSNGDKGIYTRVGKASEVNQTKTSAYCYGRAVKTITNAVNRKLEEELRAASWNSQTLREGVKVHSASLSLFGRPQQIYVTEITPSATNQLGIYHPGSLKKVSTQAAAVSALVAVNGGYFSATTQGFVRVDGTVKENGIDMSENTATFRKTFAGGAFVINNNTPSFKLVD